MALHKQPGLRDGCLSVVFITAVAGCLWGGLVLVTDILIPPFLLDAAQSGGFGLDRGDLQRVLVQMGLLGFATAAAIVMALRVLGARLGFLPPGWVELLASVLLGLVVAALMLPPDMVNQIVWLGLLLLTHGADLWRRAPRGVAS